MIDKMYQIDKDTIPDLGRGIDMAPFRLPSIRLPFFLF